MESKVGDLAIELRMSGNGRRTFVHEDMDVQVRGARLRVRRLRCEGRTPRGLIVFLHDSLGSIQTWREFPEQLCARTGCDGLIYDREGYGGSSARRFDRDKRYLHEQAEVLVQLVDRCLSAQPSPLGGEGDSPRSVELDEGNASEHRGGGFQPPGRQDAALPDAFVFFFGHSDGGTVALLGAALRPAWCAGVIAEGAHVHVEERTLAGLRGALPWWEDESFRRRVARYHGDKAEDVFRVWTQTWLSPAFRDWEVMGDLKRIECPALVVQGEHDEYATHEHARAIAQGVGGLGELFIVPGAGHTPHREDDGVLERSAAFVNRCLR